MCRRHQVGILSRFYCTATSRKFKAISPFYIGAQRLCCFNIDPWEIRAICWVRCLVEVISVELWLIGWWAKASLAYHITADRQLDLVTPSCDEQFFLCSYQVQFGDAVHCYRNFCIVRCQPCARGKVVRAGAKQSFADIGFRSSSGLPSRCQLFTFVIQSDHVSDSIYMRPPHPLNRSVVNHLASKLAHLPAPLWMSVKGRNHVRPSLQNNDYLHLARLAIVT